MTDIRDFMGGLPTHCTICGARWGDGCKPPCINAPANHAHGPISDAEAERLCAEDERRAEGR